MPVGLWEKRNARRRKAFLKNAMTGYVIVRADSHQAPAGMFQRHPHFTIFPGESVEVMECLPIPGR